MVPKLELWGLANLTSPGDDGQRCQPHFTRNILDAAPKHLQGELHSQLRVIREAPDVETARGMLKRVIDNLGIGEQGVQGRRHPGGGVR